MALSTPVGQKLSLVRREQRNLRHPGCYNSFQEGQGARARKEGNPPHHVPNHAYFMWGALVGCLP
eukprot:scaffold165241_cov20-Tisochrysis_lutea.AAC.1